MQTRRSEFILSKIFYSFISTLNIEYVFCDVCVDTLVEAYGSLFIHSDQYINTEVTVSDLCQK